MNTRVLVVAKRAYIHFTIINGLANYLFGVTGFLLPLLMLEGDNNVEHSFKNCVSFRFALTGLMSTTSCSKLSHQLEVICSHAPIISE